MYTNFVNPALGLEKYRKRRFTVEDILKLNACKSWHKEAIEEVFGKRKFLTPRQIMRLMNVSLLDKIWVVTRVFSVSERKTLWNRICQFSKKKGVLKDNLDYWIECNERVVMFYEALYERNNFEQGVIYKRKPYCFDNSLDSSFELNIGGELGKDLDTFVKNYVSFWVIYDVVDYLLGFCWKEFSHMSSSLELQVDIINLFDKYLQERGYM